MKRITFLLTILFINTYFLAVSQERTISINTIFPIGKKIKSDNFEGEPWVLRMFSADSTFTTAIGK